MGRYTEHEAPPAHTHAPNSGDIYVDIEFRLSDRMEYEHPELIAALYAVPGSMSPTVIRLVNSEGGTFKISAKPLECAIVHRPHDRTRTIRIRVYGRLEYYFSSRLVSGG